MPNSTVPAAATGLPNAPPGDRARGAIRFRLADDFTGPAGQLIALALAAQAARRRLEALQQGGARHG
jgi:hypothetical protein